MINSIIEAISISLNAEFGDNYKIYREVKKQGLREPCFFIQCLNPTKQLFLKKQYIRKNPFCIQYFPKTEQENEECLAVAERLFLCLEYLVLEDRTVRGTQMRYELVDGILHFFVDYNMFVDKVEEAVPDMEEISFQSFVKE